MTGRSSSGNSCGRESAWYSVRMKPGASMGRPHRPCRQSRLQRLPSGQGVLRRRVQRPFRRAGRYSLATTLRRSGTSHPAAGAYGRIPMGRTRYRLSSRPQGRHHPERGGRLQPLCPPYPAERPATSPYLRNAKRKRGASTAGNNNQLKIQRIMQNEDDLRGLAKVMEFMRAISILFVVVNIYWFCYQSVPGVGHRHRRCR